VSVPAVYLPSDYHNLISYFHFQPFNFCSRRHDAEGDSLEYREGKIPGPAAIFMGCSPVGCLAPNDIPYEMSFGGESKSYDDRLILLAFCA